MKNINEIDDLFLEVIYSIVDIQESLTEIIGNRSEITIKDLFDKIEKSENKFSILKEEIAQIVIADNNKEDDIVKVEETDNGFLIKE
jgi:hypothetical protein